MTEKSEQGERSNVGGVSGATLSVVPASKPRGRPRKAKKATKKKATAKPSNGLLNPDGTRIDLDSLLVQSEPSAAAAGLPAPKPARITVAAEYGNFHETAESKEAAMERAEQIAAHGAWQKVGNQMILHTANGIRRVIVVE